jgi:cyclic beta-1,2-glucan glucanotransferase
MYHITVENPHGVERAVQSVEVDGRPVGAEGIELADDGGRHEVRVILGGDVGRSSGAAT